MRLRFKDEHSAINRFIRLTLHIHIDTISYTKIQNRSKYNIHITVNAVAGTNAMLRYIAL